MNRMNGSSQNREVGSHSTDTVINGWTGVQENGDLVQRRWRPDADAGAGLAALDGVLDRLGEGIILWDSASRIVLTNQRIREFLPEVKDLLRPGTTLRNLLTQTLARGGLEIPADQTEERFLRLLVRLHGRSDGREFILRSKDGRIASVKTHRSGPGGRVTVLSEITRRVQTEEHVRRTQKMEALGKLTGGLAHDFNNYLSVIYGYLELLKLEPDLTDDAHEFIEAALEGASRGAALTRSLLSFARRQPLAPRPTDAGDAVQETLALIRRTLGEDVEIRLHLETDLPRINVDPEQLASSLVNLANNARDAMPHGGLLNISVREVVLDRNQALLHPRANPGRFVLIQVTDSGCGMTPEHRARVLEPFFTTKGPGHGTGLGLSMVYGFVTQSGGHLTLHSRPGEGTSVRLYLPLAVDEAETPDEFCESGDARGGSETVLLVEDNDEVLRSVALQLRSLGYTVVQASRADEALDILEQEEAHIDLLFTDIVMPGTMDGVAMSRLAVERFPRLRVLFTSGFAGDLLGRAPEGVRIRTLLNKPYRIHELARAVRGALTS